MSLGEEVAALYRHLLERWNDRDAVGFGAVFGEAGSVVGFDGSSNKTPAAITEHLQGIFADHVPATYVSKIREIRPLGSHAVLLRAVVGMVPPDASDIKPDLNAVQVLVAELGDDGWRVAHFQNTPARFDSRPDAASALTEELQTVLRGEA